MRLNQRAERQRNRQAYLTRIAYTLSQDASIHYSQVFKLWQFVPNSKEPVDFRKAMCQLCKNTFLKNLFKIRPVQAYRHLLPPNSKQFYKVGSICVQNFCHKDQQGKVLHPLKRQKFVKRIRDKKFKEYFFEDLWRRYEQNNIESTIKRYPRLIGILQQIKQRYKQQKCFKFEIFNDMIVFAVLLQYSLKQMTRYFFKFPSIKRINFLIFSQMQYDEVVFYSKCYQSYQNRTYKIVNCQSPSESEEEPSLQAQV